MIKIKTSQLTAKSQKPSLIDQRLSLADRAEVERSKVNIDFKVFEVHLEDNGVFIIDLDKTKNYKIKNGFLYKGIFKKIGKIKFMRIKN